MIDDELQVLGSKIKKQEHSEPQINFISNHDYDSKKKFSWGCGLFAFLLSILIVYILISLFSNVPSQENEKATTIIPKLQETVDSLLDKKMSQIDALQGQVIIMEVKTGDILAWSGRSRTFDGKTQPCNNCNYQQEQGTLMSPVSLLALLETREIELSELIDTGNGVWEYNGYFIKDHNWRRGGYGKIPLGMALEVGSDVAITKAVTQVFNCKEERYFELLRKMSIGEIDSIYGMSDFKPMTFNYPKNRNVLKQHMLINSIGIEGEMAPIQMLTFYNAIANNGIMIKPKLKKGSISIINPQIASKSNIEKIQNTLWKVANEGLVNKPDYKLEQAAGMFSHIVVNTIVGEDNINEYHVAFCGYYPAFNPKYSIIVSMNKLGFPASGGGMAAPLFYDIIEKMINEQY